MVTELFGPAEEDGKTSYVAASTTDEGMPAPNQPSPVAAAPPPAQPEPTAATTDPATDGNVV